jgi:hypothetical protein
MDPFVALPFYYPQMATPLYLQLAGTGDQHDDGAEDPPVVSSFAFPLQVHPQYQPTFQSTVVISMGTPPCCGNFCGTSVPLAINGSYNDLNGDGKSHVSFKLLASKWCGIPIAMVLCGNFTGLIGRDELAGLNPNSGSVRLRIDVSNPSSVRSSHKLTYVESGRATKDLSARSA